MLARLRQVLSYQFTVAELIGPGIIVGTPYLVIGVIWSTTHTEHLQTAARGRPGGLVPRFDRVVAGAVVLECVHDMSSAHPPASTPVGHPLQTGDTRITIDGAPPAGMTARSPSPTPLDFWSFAAGAANVVMQLSLPGVGHGVVESTVVSGSLMHHPWKRARTTFSYIAVAILGTAEDRAAYREAVDGAHRQVGPRPASPVKYNAFDRDLQMWVAACLFVGLEDTYQLLRGELTPENAEVFYRSAFPLGTTLQVTEDQWPATRAEFDDYWNAACERVLMDDTVRGYLTDLINLRMVTPFCDRARAHCSDFSLRASWRRCSATRWECGGPMRDSSGSNGCSCWWPS